MIASVAVVGAVPPEADGTGPRTAAALLAALADRGIAAWPVVLADDAAVDDAIARADAVVVIEPRPVHAELARVVRLAGARRLVLAPAGYPFCEIASRTCDRCPLAKTCAASDRVAVYRALTARADVVVYASELQRAASEAFVGAAAHTRVLAPAGVPVLADAVISLDAVAFAGGDPLEWANLADWAASHPDRALVVHGAAPPGFAPPPNLTARPPLGARAQLDLLATARTLVVLPAHPLPFGIAAAAARRAGKEVVTNDQVGLPAIAAPDLDAQLTGAADSLIAALEVDEVDSVPNSAARSRELGWGRSQLRQLGRVLLHVHHVGLGDSVNLAAIARALVGAGSAVTFVVPAAHHALLVDQVPGATVVAAPALELERARREHDVIVEVTIRSGDAYAGDIVDDRWIQLALERQPSALTPMHEQFLSLFARAGHALVPRRPEIVLGDGERAGGREVVTGAGIDPDRELVVAIHPGAGNAGKRWAAARFAELVSRLRGRGARVIVVGGPGEEAIVDEAAAGGADEQSRADVIRCGTPLRDVAAVLGAATLVVANDSGLMHVAAAVGTPVLGIFGPTSERLWGPTHPYAAGVRARGTGPTEALAALAVDDVDRALTALARRIAAEPPLSPSTRIAVAPAAAHATTAAGAEWRGRAVITIDGPDPIAPIVLACRAEPTWAELAAAHDPDLLAAVLAAEVIVPVWSLPRP